MRVNLQSVRPRCAVCGRWIYDTASTTNGKGETIHLGCEPLPEPRPRPMPVPEHPLPG